MWYNPSCLQAEEMSGLAAASGGLTSAPAQCVRRTRTLRRAQASVPCRQVVLCSADGRESLTANEGEITRGSEVAIPRRALGKLGLGVVSIGVALLVGGTQSEAALAYSVEDELELVRERAVSDIELVDEEILKRDKIAREEFEFRRAEAEAEAQASSAGKLCATPFGGRLQHVDSDGD